MVPSIYPLETLHNSLSLKQVDEFLNKVCESRRETLASTLKCRWMLVNMDIVLNIIGPLIYYYYFFAVIKLCTFSSFVPSSYESSV